MHKLWVQIHELRVQMHQLRVQIYELRLQISKLRVQIHDFKKHLTNENHILLYASKYAFKVPPPFLNVISMIWFPLSCSFAVVSSHCFTIEIQNLWFTFGFKLLVDLPFIIADEFKGQLLLWTTNVILTKVLSFSYEIGKAITLSNNSNNNNIKQTL